MSTKRSCLVALGMILGVLLVIPSTAMAWWGDWTGVPNDTNIGYTFSSCGYGNCRYIYAHNTACTARGYWGTWNTGFGWSGRGWIHNDFLVPSTNATSGIHLRVRNSGGGTWGDAAINECSYSCAWIATVDGETNNIWDYQGCYINCNDSYTTCLNECGSSITGLGPIHMYGDKWVYLNDWTCLGGYG